MTKNNTYIFIGIILLFVLLIFTFFQSKPPFWDEAYYLENITNLNKTGFSKQYLINYKGPAGPTYAIIHYLLQPITKLSVPLVRIVNIIFLVGILIYTKKIFDTLDKTKKKQFSLYYLIVVNSNNLYNIRSGFNRNICNFLYDIYDLLLGKVL